ncbi:double-strand break repair helicase AddA [Fertoebacter nigrum]|uniref:DNA 3'-5' helicase n=1 Tax=Fertoeibacter niger TaxID=2656921 RepID=A0A8X8KPP3_9RHOB|nr:double-strand break repair helicase AddA [Fertoeibacter niger]NUB45330.1 double-strand break repair helicase AddA [Fertoeibacter niger]
MRRDDATERQVQAAEPAASTWLSANAGSGKTRVLTDRVARLLLDGVQPQRILCLTYTKAAASEMQNRLFRRLGEWAMLDDAALRAALLTLGMSAAPDNDTLAQARRLFARAIETPGGLRIQTIHSFCATLLRRFPLEAGVSPQFTEMDDRAATLLREEIVEELADTLAPAAVQALARAYTGEDFARLSQEIAGQREGFATPLDDAASRALFGLPPGLDAHALLAEVLLGGEADLLAQAAAILATGSTNDVKAADKLAALSLDAPDLGTQRALEGALLFGVSKVEGKSFTAKLDELATLKTRPKLAHLQDRLNTLMRRVEQARPLRQALQAAQKTATLHAFAAAFLPVYAARKAARGWLDFDDLITRAKALLTDPSVAQWVLFRLDGGIDHILVDEAQDTSPDQWRVIELLAQEFTAGRGARDVARTIFVVGDKKQSIYSFQGADVAAFDRMKAHFAARLGEAGQPLQDLDLLHSFRSAPLLLRLVDLTFDERRSADLGGSLRHIAFKAQMPGKVELWPLIAAGSDPEPEHWFDPVDMLPEEHHAARLGRAVAARIRQMIDAGTQIPDPHAPPGELRFRAMHAGDVLILVQRRSDIFAAIIAACKAAGLPIAGADRLKLGAELAVKDLAALLAFLATPEDDLSLAAALKSPLFGWTEAQLYTLAQPRKGYLWQALRNDPSHTATVAVLQDMRDQADYLRPYDLIERMLTRHGGRQALLARLGAEAEDGIDELLSQALAYERSDVPSLTGFLGWLQTDDVEVKRQMDAAGGRIRVMTVHGAKGLEAPVVILPDTADRDPPERGEIFLADGVPVWKTPAPDSPALIANARDFRKAQAAAENMRLLYVAMTRAQCWLIVAAAGKLERGDAWHDLIRQGMVAAGAEAADNGLRLTEGDWPADAPAPPAAADTLPTLPPWANSPAAEPQRPPQLLSPSDLGGAKALPGEAALLGEEAAKLRGTRLHLLLEHLPGQDAALWPGLTDALLPGVEGRDILLAEVQALLAAPALASFFAPDALREVTITADILGHRMLGTIDRLILSPGKLLAVDYKSNALVPAQPGDVPPGLMRQMAAYAEGLRQIYPDRQVEVAILWTKTAQLMLLPCDMLGSALRSATIP